MKNAKHCTGPRWEGETLCNLACPGWHGKYGHINLGWLDHDDARTGYGKHDRIVACCPEGEKGYARVDHVWGLGMPSDTEVVKYYKAHSDVRPLRGKWRVASKRLWDDGKCTEINLVMEQGK